MPKAVVEDLDKFYAYLAMQPLCQWAAQKQIEFAANELRGHGNGSGIHAPAKKNDNAELAAALSAMA